MTKNDQHIAGIIQKIRNIYVTKYETQITKGYTINDLEKEIDYILHKFDHQQKCQEELIKDLDTRLQNNSFEPIVYKEDSTFINEFINRINIYLEKLKNKMISKEFFQKIFNEIPVNMIVFDKQLKIENVNKCGIDYFAVKGEFDKHNFEVSFPKVISEELNNFHTSKLQKKEVEFICMKDEKEIQISGYLSKISLNNQDFTLFISRDTTERKNRQLKILEATIEGQEVERKRLAIEIHDSLGQELSSLKMNLNSIQNTNTSSDRYQLSMGNMNEIVKNAVQTVKDISFNLKPTLLSTLNLKAALSRLIEVMSSPSLKIQFKCDENELKFKNKHEELFVYRIIQEFLNNTYKHAYATKVVISVTKNIQKKKYNFKLKDNGIGFEFQENGTNYGNGISNIYHRLQIMDTKFSFTSEVNKGTFLEFYIAY